MVRTKLRRVAIALAFVALAAIVAWKAWNVAGSRPGIAEQSALEVFGIDRASVPAPPLDLAAIDGTRFSLADARGQIVFVNFWATWCPPCRDEMPSMLRLGQEVAARHPGRFKMVAVSVDDGWNPIREFFAAPPFRGIPDGVTVALDEDQSATRSYYCTARGFCPDIKFPETYIVDGTGRLVGYVVGPRDWSHPAARTFLEQLIGS
jgi:thiol-disulfide isomerase/thioredoxin